METVKKVRKPRQPKVEKPKVEKPMKTPKLQVEKPMKAPKLKVEKPMKAPKLKVEKPMKAPIEFKNIDNDEALKKIFLEDLDFIYRDTSKKINKIKENTKLSAEEKHKKIGRLIKKIEKFTIKYGQNMDKNGEAFKQMQLEKERNFG